MIKEKYQNQLQHQKRLHQLELKALRSQLNPHFVHNSLNAIQYYIQQNDVETSENYLTKFSKLMRMFFDYSNKASITINEEIKLLKHYLAIEKMRFEDKLDYKITIDKDIDKDNTTIPTMLLQPLVENAINHGIFHKTGRGTLQVKFKFINKNSYSVSVIDDGVGINKTLAMKSKLSKRYNSSTVLEERLLLLKQNSIFNINQTVTDLSNTSNTTGTNVCLTITQK